MGLIDLPEDVLRKIVNHVIHECKDQANIRAAGPELRRAVTFERVSATRDTLARAMALGGCKELTVRANLTDVIREATAAPERYACLRKLDIRPFGCTVREEGSLTALVDSLLARVPSLCEVVLQAYATNPALDPRVRVRYLKIDCERRNFDANGDEWAVGGWPDVKYMEVFGGVEPSDVDRLERALAMGLRTVALKVITNIWFRDPNTCQRFVAFAVSVAERVTCFQPNLCAILARAVGQDGVAAARVSHISFYHPPKDALAPLFRAGGPLRSLHLSGRYLAQASAADAVSVRALLADGVAELRLTTPSVAFRDVLVGATALRTLVLDCDTAVEAMALLGRPGAAPELSELTLTIWRTTLGALDNGAAELAELGDHLAGRSRLLTVNVKHTSKAPAMVAFRARFLHASVPAAA